jgi:hypothetical protein
VRDITEMAREANMPFYWRSGEITYLEQLKVFEAIVRADERERLAKMIEDAPPLMPFAQNDQGGCLMCGFTPKLAAKHIRAGGQP